MKKTTSTIAMIGALTLGGASGAQAQAPLPDGGAFVNISGGAQFTGRTISESKTFTLFNETGTIASNQNVGAGFVFDGSVGYHVWDTVAIAGGISTFNGGGTAAVAASIPSPLFGGLPVIRTFSEDDFGDLGQSNIAINIQLVWLTPLNERWDLAVFVGPSFIRVKQQLASATADINSVATIDTESKTTAKAGSAGVDLIYRMNDRYGFGGFVRFLGGEVDLPSVPNMKVGGFEMAGGIRIRM